MSGIAGITGFLLIRQNAREPCCSCSSLASSMFLESKRQQQESSKANLKDWLNILWLL